MNTYHFANVTTLTKHRADKLVILSVYLQMVFEMRLPQEYTVAVLVWAAKLLCVLVRVSVSAQFLLCSKRLVTALYDATIKITKLLSFCGLSRTNVKPYILKKVNISYPLD